MRTVFMRTTRKKRQLLIAKYNRKKPQRDVWRPEIGKSSFQTCLAFFSNSKFSTLYLPFLFNSSFRDLCSAFVSSSFRTFYLDCCA